MNISRSEELEALLEELEALLEELEALLEELEATIRKIPAGQNPGTSPVKALQAWVEASEIEDGKVFRAITRHGVLADRLTGNQLPS